MKKLRFNNSIRPTEKNDAPVGFRSIAGPCFLSVLVAAAALLSSCQATALLSEVQHRVQVAENGSTSGTTVAPTYTVTYDANGAVSGTVPVDSNKYAKGQTVTVLGNTGSLVRSGYTFVGWNAAPDGSGTTYYSGTTFTMGSVDFTLYADWIASLGALTANDGAASDYFGNSITSSSDGSTLVVGACGSNSSQGAVYVFMKSGSVWSQAQKLTAIDGAAIDTFGDSIASSSDGSTLVVGAINKTVGSNSEQGAVYVFAKSGGSWSQVQELTASDGAANDYFGSSVASSSDGSTLIVGAKGFNSSQGAVYLFTKTGGSWVQAQELTALDGVTNDNFGSSVAGSNDGSTLVVGALQKPVGSNGYQGTAYVFTKTGGSWVQTQELTATDGASHDYFGHSVAISSDGSTLVVGAYYKTVGSNTGQGTAYVFTKPGGSWSQVQELTASDGAAYNLFGYSVDSSNNGSTILVGADSKEVGSNSSQGSVYVFTKSGNGWNQAQELIASDGSAGDHFGFSAASSSDGSTLAVGASNKTVGSNTLQGATYIFEKYGNTWVQ